MTSSSAWTNSVGKLASKNEGARALPVLRRLRTGCVAAVVVVSGLVPSGGCNSRNPPEMGTVAGVVTLDDKRLLNATVRLFPTSGCPSQAITRADGTYELYYVGGESGALVGEHRVTSAPIC